MSSHPINKPTRVFSSLNNHLEHRQGISNILGFNSMDDLGKHHGIPILHKRVNKDTLRFIIEKVDHRLSNWKARNLSLVGRLTLTKPVIQALPTYMMQAANLPQSICEAINKICRSFIWGDEDDKLKMHLINWQTVCNTKNQGGLGLRSTRHVNQTFLYQNSWKLCTQQNSLWVSVIRNKYKCGNDIIPRINGQRVGSNL